ncbi:MAG: AI-2E family transporter [Proteobacteria bacterium]|nr:AI-2E family transporter [Pseudomonadota bacterium]
MDPSIVESAAISATAEGRRREWLVIAVVAGVLIWLLAPVLVPFAISAFFGYLGDPLADRLERARLSRTASVSLVFLAMTLLAGLALFFLLPVVGGQVSHFVAQMPVYAEWVRGTALPWVDAHVHVDLSPYLDPQQLVEMLRKHWQDAGVATSFLGQVSRSGMVMIQVISTVLLVPVLSFYFLRDWDVLVERIDMLLPRAIEPTIARLARQSDEMLGGFVRGQLLVMMCMGGWYAIALWMVGLDLALLIGLITGMLSFVPYLGVTIGICVSVMAALVQYGDFQHVLLVAGAFAIGQTLESFVLVPRLVGDKIGMHPVGVIFALMAGGQLFGFLGVLLALPMSAIAMVLLRYAHERYTASRLYVGRQGASAMPSDDAPVDGEAPPSAC